MGATGATGSQGPKGDAGATGPVGPQGDTGATGATGAQGDVGPTGPQGVQGIQGLTGATGATGPQGYQVTFGTTPPANPENGYEWIDSVTGIKYTWVVDGDSSQWVELGGNISAGPTGPTGAQGEVGPTGAQGIQGEVGPTGAQGIQGIQGETGPTGATGAQGIQGEAGPTGPAGANGTIGQDGATGPTGPTGSVNSWTVKTAAYTAVDHDRIIADTSGGAFAITLPATPATGAQVQITDGSDWQTNNLTVERNGSTIEGLSQDLLLTVGNIIVDFIYDGTTWQVITSIGAQGATGPTGPEGVFDVTVDTFTGDGSTTDYTLSIAPVDENHVIAVIQGVTQAKSAYTVTGTTLSFSAAPANGDGVEITVLRGGGVQGPTGPAGAGVQVDTSTVATTSATDIFSYTSANYPGAKFIVTMEDSVSGESMIIEALMLTNGASPMMTTYASVYSGAAALGTLSTYASGGSTVLAVTLANANSTTVKVAYTLID